MSIGALAALRPLPWSCYMIWMLLCRLLLPGQTSPCFARVLPDRPDELVIMDEAGQVAGTLPVGPDLWDPDGPGDPARPRLLCPVSPGKIIGVGSNYHNHTLEMGKPIPREPILFMKPPSALLPPGGAIARPPGYARVDYEGELAVVVGRPMHRVPEEQVFHHLLGYTALNDVTVRDLQKQDGQFTRAKGFDTFCPLGPAICTDLQPIMDGTFRLRTRKNGTLVQDSQGDRFLFSVARLVSFTSHVMTLQPGDVISTGTPAGVGNLDPGDVIEIEITGLPPLKNPVIAGQRPL
jgi:2-keto-4-pentenoate hydratase/2-oxohepta-3-ene-1,7-dioic acid hydratase in catechol pathway